MKYNKESYITAAPDPERWKNHVNNKTLNEFSSLITGSILDVGCNHGATTYWLKDYNVSSITGIDINSQSLEYARNLFNTVDIPSKFVNLDLTQESLDEVFDTVISFHTLEHIYPEDVDAFLTNIYNMLREDGYFIIGIPYDHAYSDPCHVAFYTEPTLNAVMLKNKFKLIDCFKDDRWDDKNILTGIYRK